MIVDTLKWIGLIRINDNGTIRWPIRVDRPWYWKSLVFHEPFGLFRNLPEVIKWEPGRLLPRRWGFRIFWFEFGDRG